MKSVKTAALLQKAYERKRLASQRYTKAAFARDLDVSAAFVGAMLNGKKSPPKHKAERIAYLLELDPYEKEVFFKNIFFSESFSGTLPTLESGIAKNPNEGRKEIVSDSRFSLLSKWWHIPVMEGLSLKGSLSNIDSLAERLGLTDSQIKETIAGLRVLGLVSVKDETLTKSDDHTYVPTGRSKSEVRTFHKNMIQKSLDELKNTDIQDFDRRLITGTTFSLNSKQTEKLKTLVMNFLNEVSSTATEGPCDEVYQCNVQLFPLTSLRPNRSK